MRFVNESGLWTTGPVPEAAPLTTVLEICGAVLSWTVDDPAHEVHIAFTDPVRADWLWRIVGESGHSSIAEALETGDPTVELKVADVDVVSGSLETLRRLALGHWLRRWWPSSSRDGIAELDAALLDGEVALLTDAAMDFFGEDGTFDSDVAGLLRPHAQALNGLARQEDPRVVELVRRCTELAEDSGVVVAESAVVTEARRDDYALAAGAGAVGGRREAVAAGVSSVRWAAVPQGIFDSAEGTLGWSVEADGANVSAVINAEVSGPGSPAGIAVRVRSGGISGAGALDAAGSATLRLSDDQLSPVTETAAWNHDWRDTEVSVGVDVAEDQQVRDRVRAFARTRLRHPGADAYLAEILAAESDY